MAQRGEIHVLFAFRFENPRYNKFLVFYSNICVQLQLCNWTKYILLLFATVLSSLIVVLPQDIMYPMTTASSTSSVMWPTKGRSGEPALHSCFVPTALQRMSCWLWRMNATLTSWWSPPRLAFLRYSVPQQHYWIHSSSTANLIFKLIPFDMNTMHSCEECILFEHVGVLSLKIIKWLA